MKYDRIIRWLHAGIALGVSVQLCSSLFMDVPAPARPLAGTGYQVFLVHRWSGVTIATLVILHWFWGLSGHVTGGWGHLFPWFSGPRFRHLMSDIRDVPKWLQGAFPSQQAETIPLAGAIHGLGLLAVSAMALSGTIIFFLMGPHGTVSPLVAIVRQGHSYMGRVVWVYLLGHVGIALLHQLRGDRLITNMFNLLRR
jgi:cytochrome b561